MMTLADTGAVYNVPRLVPVSSPPYARVLRWPHMATATMMSINIFLPYLTNNYN